MKLSEWAREVGIQYVTAYRMFKAGKLPMPYEQLSTGTILVYPEKELRKGNKAVLYARVSSYDQKEDLTRQLNRLKDFSASQGIVITDEYTEIGSGVNGNRKKLSKILSDPNISLIIVEHKDRLGRFGVDMLIDALSASGRRILMINESEYKDDLVQDFIDVVTAMCARIYGKRSAKNKAKKALSAVEEDR